ncbi:MAG: hypothetical protein D3923_07635, partial [Candidatus Electrothrix sp. AR3]|nr:hypothetical protein [Candidatus Electrothrix sp. AR3]
RELNFCHDFSLWIVTQYSVYELASKHKKFEMKKQEEPSVRVADRLGKEVSRTFHLLKGKEKKIKPVSNP